MSYQANSGQVTAAVRRGGQVEIQIAAGEARITIEMSADEAEKFAVGLRSHAELARKVIQ